MGNRCDKITVVLRMISHRTLRTALWALSAATSRSYLQGVDRSVGDMCDQNIALEVTLRRALRTRLLAPSAANSRSHL